MGSEMCIRDRAHSFGTYGKTGRGICEDEGVMDVVDFYTGTFSKSLAAIGGFVASRHKELEALRFSSRPYQFTASSSPASIVSANVALKTIAKDSSLREQLWSNANRLHAAMVQLGLTVAADAAPVISVLFPTKEIAFAAWNFLLENGVYVNLAIPPGTPGTQSLIRLAVSAAHTPDDIDKIVSAYTAMVDAVADVREPMQA